jgi:serine protease Do
MVSRKTLKRARGEFRSPYGLGSLLWVLPLLFLLIPAAHAGQSLRRSPVVAAVERVSPAVVNISTVVRERVSPFFPFAGDDFFRDFFPDLFSREYSRSSLGSGVVIDGEKGYILTNHHVVAGATEIKVVTADQKEYGARILGSDPRSDLAVLRIEAGKGLPEVGMGDSGDLMIGETVIAIGNPFGLSHTVTTGVISAVDRSVRSDRHVYRGFIQTDASINPGNSGGPLLNMEGDLIGINTAIYQKAQGIGFAIPINKAKRIVRELLRAGEVRPVWLGLEVQELTPALRSHFSIPPKTQGVLVSDAAEGSPAGKAGVRRGDILLGIQGFPVPTTGDYRETLAEFTPGDRLRLRLFRNGKELEVVVQPAAFPPEMAPALFYSRLGIEVGEPDARTRNLAGGGVMIKGVRPGSEAAEIGLEPGDLIVQVNDRAVGNLDDFKKSISEVHHLPSLRLVVQRGRRAYALTLPF